MSKKLQASTTQPKPTQPKPTQPKPTQPKPTQPKPTQPKPTVQAQTWKMVLYKDFIPEFRNLTPEVKKNLMAIASAVGKVGPSAGRPHVDSLVNPPNPNIKEMRFSSNLGKEVWRAAFAFDKNSDGIILCAGEKSAVKSAVFYKKLLKKANDRLKKHNDNINQIILSAGKKK